MYVAVIHEITDPEAAFTRGAKLISNRDAPAGVRGLSFYPSVDRTAVTCLWEAESVEDIREYVDSTLGDAAVNTVYEVDPDFSFARQPLGIATSPPVAA